MKNRYASLSFTISLLVHLVLTIALIRGYYSSYIPTKFVVLGAHSQKPTQAYYKSVPQHYTAPQTQSRVKLPKKPVKKATPTSFSQKKKNKRRIKNPLKKRKKNKKKKNKLQKRNNKQQIKKKKNPGKINQVQKKSPSLPKSNIAASQQTQAIPQQKQAATDKRYSKKHLHYFRMIQEEVMRVWEPPVGIPKGTECTVLFSIDNHGNVQHFELIKRSNMLLYDLSITQAAQSFNFNKALWGRQFTISFRQ